MKQYDIILKNEKVKTYHMIHRIVIGLHILVFLFIGVSAGDRRMSIGGFIAAGLLLFCLFLWYQFRQTKYRLSFHYFYFVCMFAWGFFNFYYLAVIPLVMDILFTMSIRPKVTSFTKDRITYPSFPKKNIPWSDLNNSILKDGLLTLDFRDNHIIQQAVDEMQTAVDEKEFNAFCREQLING